jgi:hypothetical protein
VALEATSSRSGAVLSFSAGQAALNSALRCRGLCTDGDVPEPDAWRALAGTTNPADALPAPEHGIVVDADRAYVQLRVHGRFRDLFLKNGWARAAIHIVAKFESSR